MDFWRGPAYTAFFEHLERSGGFYYEVRDAITSIGNLLNAFLGQRWGDAPVSRSCYPAYLPRDKDLQVHSIAASLLAGKDQIHFFDEIGYQHDSWSHCPQNRTAWEEGQCDCDRDSSFGQFRPCSNC